MPTKIEWCTETWNPIVGCSKCSPGCDHCYAERMANRQANMATKKGINDITHGQGKYVSVISPGGEWNGSIRVDCGPELYKPLRWKKPRLIFVVSMGDLFHERNSYSDFCEICRIQEEANQHIYIWLTKRPKTMFRYATNRYGNNIPDNIWGMVTVCNQKEADEKIPTLINTPFNVRGVSIEPMLENIDLQYPTFNGADDLYSLTGLNWVIVGGESGPGARPTYPGWVRGIHDQCADAGIPFFFKQWGDYIPEDCKKSPAYFISKWYRSGWRYFEKKHGNLLDGKIYNEYPYQKENLNA